MERWWFPARKRNPTVTKVNKFNYFCGRNKGLLRKRAAPLFYLEIGGERHYIP
jgi:hypothetical protein